MRQGREVEIRCPLCIYLKDLTLGFNLYHLKGQKEPQDNESLPLVLGNVALGEAAPAF